MNYAAAVAEGRKLLSRSEADQWALAELTYEVIEAGKRGIVSEWARDLGVSQGHVSKLCAVWKRFGNHSGRNAAGLSFNECYVRASMSAETEERARRRAEENGRTVSHEERSGRPGDRVRTARDVLRDKKLRKQVFDDPEIWTALEPEFRRRMRERKRGADGHATTPDPLTVARLALRDALQWMLDSGMTKPQRRQAPLALHEMDTLVDWAVGLIERRDRSFEDAFEALLADDGPARLPKGAEEKVEPPKRRRKPPAVVDVPHTPPPDVPTPPAEPPTRRRLDRGHKERRRRVS